MAQEILTTIQKKFISLFAREKRLSDNFYLTGGTALAAYYLGHRYSEDLDFFSYNEIDVMAINVFLKGVKKSLKVRKIDFQRTFNRNIFFLLTKGEVLKTEFTYFPFEPIGKAVKKDGIYIDSLEDIAVNKVFTIAQNPRARDFIDIYFILTRHKKLSFSRLIRMAKAKFDWHVDAIQVGTQLLRAKDLKDLPRMRIAIEGKKWRDFFVVHAKALAKDTLC